MKKCHTLIFCSTLVCLLVPGIAANASATKDVYDLKSIKSFEKAMQKCSSESNKLSFASQQSEDCKSVSHICLDRNRSIKKDIWVSAPTTTCESVDDESIKTKEKRAIERPKVKEFLAKNAASRG